MKPNGGGAPTGKLADAINAKWGSFDAFKEAFTKFFRRATSVPAGHGWSRRPTARSTFVNTALLARR